MLYVCLIFSFSIIMMTGELKIEVKASAVSMFRADILKFYILICTYSQKS